jgi:hypothetical protein
MNFFLKVNWATEEPIGTILYNTYNESDFDAMAYLYNYYGGAWNGKTKLNLNAKTKTKIMKKKIKKI